MQFIDILLIGLALSMDAFAVSASNGLAYKPNAKNTVAIAIAFGFFQAIMPLIGYFGGTLFASAFDTYAPYIALILLSVIGIKMLIEATKKEKKEHSDNATSFTFKLLFLQAVATSIDALIVGVSFVGIKFSVYVAVLIIGVITFILCYIGVVIGKKFGNIMGKKAEIVGGVILILIGVKIFLESIL